MTELHPMSDVVHGNLYDFPRYYDLIFGSDWKAEFRFLEQCFAKHARRQVGRLFEPACGTGRLLIKLARKGYEVAGNDLNPRAIEFCNQRLARNGFPATAEVGDMSNFTLRRKVDAAFNTINSFRHLPTEAAAEAHLRCVAAALAKGGLYVLGLHLTPLNGPRCEDEAWSARRGNLAVNSYMWSKEINLKKRNERLGMTFNVYTPTRHLRIEDEMNYRTYTQPQMAALLNRTPELECVATYDFCYEIDHPITVDAGTEDVVFVLRKR